MITRTVKVPPRPKPPLPVNLLGRPFKKNTHVGMDCLKELQIKYRVQTDRNLLDDIVSVMREELAGKRDPIYCPILFKKMLPNKLDVSSVDRHILQVFRSDGTVINLPEAFK